MLRELIALLRGSDPLREMQNELVGMIANGQRMLEMTWKEIASGQVRKHARDEIEGIDVKVNRSERWIRRRIAEHIVVNPSSDMLTCLALMSIVKDAERLGDYCKDILDAAELDVQRLSDNPCFCDFDDIYRRIHQLLNTLQQTLQEADRSLAEEVMLKERNIRVECDALLARLVSTCEPGSTGIRLALISRYLRRTAGHASNVASSLVMPLHKLDYHDPEWLGRTEESSHEEKG